MTNQEATDVERMYYKACRNEAECGKITRYAGYLKDFILYLRHGIKTQKIRNLNLAAF